MRSGFKPVIIPQPFHTPSVACDLLRRRIPVWRSGPVREQSGQTSWKRQISWFEPHPDVFQRLSLEANGDGRPDKTRSGTAPPPVLGQAFVPQSLARWWLGGRPLGFPPCSAARLFHFAPPLQRCLLAV